MKIHSKALTVAVLFALLMTALLCNISTDASDDPSAAVSEDTAPSVFLTNTLYFSDQTSGQASADTINKLAKTTVCSYSSDCLTFTKSVNIYLTSNVSTKGVLVFNGIGTQTVKVTSDVSVIVSYQGSVASDADTGAITKKEIGDLVFNGDGALYSSSLVSNSYGIVSANDIYFKGRTGIVAVHNGVNIKGGALCRNAYCEEWSALVIHGGDNGIVLTDSGISFIGCSAKIYGCSEYGVTCNNSYNVNIERCELDISGEKRAFGNNPTVSNTKCNVYGSYDINSKDDMNDISAQSIGNYRHVVTSEISFGSGRIDDPLLLWATIPFAIGVIPIIYMALKMRTGGIKGIKKDKALKNEYSQPVSVTRYDDPNRKECAGVAVVSLVKDETFALVVDNAIAGFIGPEVSHIDIEVGRHMIIIVTNDSERNVIYESKENIFIGTVITVSKSIRTYDVEISSRITEWDVPNDAGSKESL